MSEAILAEIMPDVHGDPETVLAEIHAQNLTIISQNEKIAETLDGILQVVADAKGEIMPLMQRLESNPMMKMLLGRNK